MGGATSHNRNSLFYDPHISRSPSF